MRALMDAARAEVLGLGAANMSNISERASSVLSSLVNLVKAFDRDGSSRQQLAELEFQAERLRRASGASFAQTDWVRLGLLAALEALPRVARSEQTNVRFVEVARRAADAIPQRSALIFHHGAIQDAARATIDAYALSIQGATFCPPLREVAPQNASSRATANE